MRMNKLPPLLLAVLGTYQQYVPHREELVQRMCRCKSNPSSTSWLAVRQRNKLTHEAQTPSMSERSEHQ
jgi:hypothetical protein